MKDDNSIETCPRCGGWVWHRQTPCDCNRKTLEQENAALRARLERIEYAIKSQEEGDVEAILVDGREWISRSDLLAALEVVTNDIA